MNDNKKYILVTGGAGYIGSHTVVSLYQNGYIPVIIDDFRNSNLDVVERLSELIDDELIYFSMTCQNEERLRGVFIQFPIWGVIHFAADKSVSESVLNPLKYFDNNIGGLISILRLAEEFNVNHFVFSSSCTVYGEPEKIPVDESFPVSYSSPYGYTKKVNEEMIAQFVESKNHFKASLLRYFNPIGAHESGKIGDEPQGKPDNLLPFITQTAIGLRDEITVFGNDYDTPDGTCIRDFVHVVDLAEAHVRALEQVAKSEENLQIFNIGTGKGTSVLELIHSFEENTGVKLPYKIGPRRPGDIPAIYADTSKAKNELNWSSRLTVADAVRSAWKFEQYIRNKRSVNA
ncbi:MAG: UDP-glucose 4-epimerase GalE [Brumimicrobium sp.]|nr:UDP-glucose 4-epimerase GalE [Brumimicrobium sp.]